MIRKWLLVSDIHGHWNALNETLKHISYDRMCCLGDVVASTGTLTEDERRILQIIDRRWQLVQGEHDVLKCRKVAPAEPLLDRLCQAPSILESEMGLTDTHTKTVCLVHASPLSAGSFEEYIFPDASDQVLQKHFSPSAADIFLVGHVHIPFVRACEIGGKKRFIINPGATGGSQYAGFLSNLSTDKRASCAVLDTFAWLINFYRVPFESGYQVTSVRADELVCSVQLDFERGIPDVRFSKEVEGRPFVYVPGEHS